MMVLFEETKNLIFVVLRAVYFFRQQNFNKSFAVTGRVIQLLQNYMGYLPEQLCGELLSVLEMLLEAMEEQDGTQIADLLEDGLLPMLYQIQQSVFEEMEDALADCWGKNRRILKERFPEIYRKVLECREEIPDKYRLAWAKSGDLVLEVATETQGTIRMNSMSNPNAEAMLFAERMFGTKAYCVVGFGLGYHIEYLLRDKICKKIVILEHDMNQLAIALSYRDLSYVLEDRRVEIVHSFSDEIYAKYMNQKDDDTQICIWYPSVKTLEDDLIREKLEDYQVKLSSIENIGSILDNNFEINIKNNDNEVSSLKEKFKGKEVIFAAGGPSLDNSLEFLRKQSERILVCVGKVAKKLIMSGIRPDYIIMTDGLYRSRWQIEGIENSGVPLIYLSTVASEVTDKYQGKRYIAFQERFPQAEDYAGKMGYSLYQSGGSVATFALDLLIRFECAQIICVGLDMGYPGDRTHASGIGSEITSKEKLRKVEGVASDYVYTSKTLDIYRIWIENRIKNVKQTELLNASKGARIHGMKEVELKDYI